MDWHGKNPISQKEEETQRITISKAHHSKIDTSSNDSQKKKVKKSKSLCGML
jgi:hypothetical protein